MNKKDTKEKLNRRLMISAFFAVCIIVVFYFYKAQWAMWMCFILAVPIVVINFEFYRRGFFNLFKGTADSNTLIAIGTLISLILLRFDWTGIILTLSAFLIWINAERIPYQQAEEKFSAGRVYMVMGIAAVTAIIWTVAAGSKDIGLEHGLMCGISVLLIYCPYVREISESIAFSTARTKGEKEGIIVKSDEIVEILGKVDTVIFGKTGVVTHGELKVTDVITVADLERNRLLEIASQLEAKSKHPIAKAISMEAEENGIKAEAAQAAAGRYFIGSRRYIKNILNAANFPQEIVFTLEELQKCGKTTVLLCDEKELIGIIALKDDIKATSVEAITMIGAMGIETVMITGDSQAAADTISRQAGITRNFADVLSEEREKVIRELRECGKTVAIVSNASDDKPIVDLADVNIVIGGRKHAADVILLKQELTEAEKALKLGRLTLKNIKLSRIGAFVYHVIAIPVAAGLLYPIFRILINPALAASIMTVLYMCIVMNSLSIKNKNLL